MQSMGRGVGRKRDKRRQKGNTMFSIFSNLTHPIVTEGLYIHGAGGSHLLDDSFGIPDEGVYKTVVRRGGNANPMYDDPSYEPYTDDPYARIYQARENEESKDSLKEFLLDLFSYPPRGSISGYSSKVFRVKRTA